MARLSDGVVLPKTPFRVELEVTTACNMNCIYCYAKPSSNQTPSIEDIEFLLTKIKNEAKPFEIVLLGGEPFLRKDIMDVIGLASQFFKRFGLYTNGTLISRLDKEALDELRNLSANRHFIAVSLDSVNPSVNDVTRGLTSQTLKGLQVMEESGIDFSINSVCTVHNINTFEETMCYLLRNFKHFVGMYFGCLEPTSVLGVRYFQLAVDEDSISVPKQRFNQLRKELKRDDVSILSRNKEYIDKSIFNKYEFSFCESGSTFGGVLVNGDVVPCPLIRSVKVGNLYTESWSDIWKRSIDNYKKNIDYGVEGRKCGLINIKVPDNLKESKFVKKKGC